MKEGKDWTEYNGRNYGDGNVSKHVEDEKATLMRGIWTFQCLNMDCALHIRQWLLFYYILL